MSRLQHRATIHTGIGIIPEDLIGRCMDGGGGISEAEQNQTACGPQEPHPRLKLTLARRFLPRYHAKSDGRPHLLGFGNQLEVLEPIALCEEFRKIVTGMAANFIQPD